jgi:hypothetical protein
VQHCAIAQTIAKSIESFDPAWLAEDGGLDRLDQLSRLLDREHRAMLALARSMRLTHQSQDRKVAARRAHAQSGWGSIGMDDGEVRAAPWERHR